MGAPKPSSLVALEVVHTWGGSAQHAELFDGAKDVTVGDAPASFLLPPEALSAQAEPHHGPRLNSELAALMSGFDELLTVAATLPEDAERATLVGRVWLPGDTPGPGIVTVRDGQLWG